MSNIIASIINYTKNIWHNTDQDIVMAEHINAWENSIENMSNYDEEIKNSGGIDIQLLGIGSNGHIAFNEPFTNIDEKTHIVELTENTIKDNSRFFKSISEVPTKAITMGLNTILQSKEIFLIATGKNKSMAVKKMLEGKYDPSCPASCLNLAKCKVHVYIDDECYEGIK